MSASLRSLLLYDLLAPEFLSGFTFPDYIDSYLKLLAVSGLTMTSDDSSSGYTGGVLYTGTVYFPTGDGSQPAVTQHTDPSGAVFQWSDVNFQFRLRVWREGSSDIQTVVNTLGLVPGANSTIKSLFTNFDPASGAVLGSPEYPGLRFRLELLLTVLTFHMGSDWVPGKMDAQYRVVQDTSSASTDVKILLPTITLVYEQQENFSAAPTFKLASWGSSGFDAPSDLGSGQLVTMQPPLALNTNQRVGLRGAEHPARSRPEQYAVRNSGPVQRGRGLHRRLHQIAAVLLRGYGQGLRVQHPGPGRTHLVPGAGVDGGRARLDVRPVIASAVGRAGGHAIVYRR